MDKGVCNMQRSSAVITGDRWDSMEGNTIVACGWSPFDACQVLISTWMITAGATGDAAVFHFLFDQGAYLSSGYGAG